MAQFRFIVTVETENEVSAEAQQIAANLAAQAAANSAEESGGGATTADGVIEGG
jgi:hypothetical protein